MIFFDNLRLGTKVGFHEPGCGRTAPEINLNQPSSNHPISLSDFSYRNVDIYFFKIMKTRKDPKFLDINCDLFLELNVKRLKFFLISGFQGCFMPLRIFEFKEKSPYPGLKGEVLNSMFPFVVQSLKLKHLLV